MPAGIGGPLLFSVRLSPRARSPGLKGVLAKNALWEVTALEWGCSRRGLGALGRKAARRIHSVRY